MTAYEAIKELSHDDSAYGGRCTKEVRDVAIKALIAVQQLPDIVKELEEMAKDYERLAETFPSGPISVEDYASGKKVGLQTSLNLLNILLKQLVIK